MSIECPQSVKVFRRRPSQTFPHARGLRLKTSKGRNRGKGHARLAPPKLVTDAEVPVCLPPPGLQNRGVSKG